MNEFIMGIVSNYAQFFNMDALLSVAYNPMNWAVIGSLIVLEGLLSAEKAFFYGIFGIIGAKMMGSVFGFHTREV